MAQLNDTMVQGDLRVTGNIYGNINGNAATATSAGKLTTARKTYVTLGTASTTTTRDWSGDTTIPVNGTLAISNGGTGATQVTGTSGAVHNLTNDNVSTASKWFLTITDNWARCGYCSVADAKKVLGLGSAAYTESTAYAPSSTVSCTTTNVKSALGTSSGTSKYLREDGTWQTPPDTNTWRGIQNNLTSDSTTDSLSAAQGKTLNTNKLDKTTNLAGSKISETDIMAVNGSTDGFKMSYSATSSDLGKMKLHTIDDANAILSLGNTVSGSYKEAITIVNGSATITGSLTGNCSGSSGSCTGNAATASAAESGSALETAINGKVPTSRTVNGKALTGNITLSASDVSAAPSSTVSCTTANVKSALGTGSGTSKYLREDGSWQIPPDHTYTVNNAALKIQINGGTASNKFTANASTDATLAFATGSTNGTIKVDSTEVAVKGLGDAAYKGVGTGSSQVAAGNHNHDATYMKASSGNKSLSYGGTTTIGTANGSNVNLVMPAANGDVFEVNANSTSFSDALSAYNDGKKKLVLIAGRQGTGSFTTRYEIPLYRVVLNGTTITQFVWIASDDAYNAASGSNTFGAIMYYKLSSSGWDIGSNNIDFAQVAGRTIGDVVSATANSALTWGASVQNLLLTKSSGEVTVDVKNLIVGQVYWLHVGRALKVKFKNSGGACTMYAYGSSGTIDNVHTFDIQDNINYTKHGAFSVAVIHSSTTVYYAMMSYGDAH